MKKLLPFICLLITVSLSQAQPYYQNQTIVLSFETDEISEISPRNPFLDYRLLVTFTDGKDTYTIPGYFAADGDAANTGAASGKVWTVKFTPHSAGQWNYTVSFKKGKNIAISDDPFEGNSIEPIDGTKGNFTVQPIPQNATGFDKSGRLIYNNSRYLFTEDGKPMLKFGANSPENFFAFNEFDNTYPYDPNKSFPKTWEPHIRDWKQGDPTWQNGKGKGIIGALNYLAAQKMNCVYALTLNIEGDARDVWPFISHKKEHRLRYDVSKLEQWDIVISHAEKLGIIMNLVTQEKENELLLDDGDTRFERKLYYRELIARFAHHKNIIWNMGEENGQVEWWPEGQNDQQRFSMIRYIKDHDPYKNPVVIHTMSSRDHRDPILENLVGFNRLDGISMQVSEVEEIHEDFLKWIEITEEKGRPWIMMMDEIGPWHTGTRPDIEDPKHDTLRHEVLWGTLMAGGTGLEWYFGWLTPPHDLNAEDWRSRENIWKQSHIAHQFFKKLPYTQMKNTNHLIDQKNAYCFSKSNEVYVVYTKDGKPVTLDLSEVEGTFQLKWYDPRNGGKMHDGSVKEIQAGAQVNLGFPPGDTNEDWVILVRR